jgi:hypothetical protein
MKASWKEMQKACGGMEIQSNSEPYPNILIQNMIKRKNSISFPLKSLCLVGLLLAGHRFYAQNANEFHTENRFRNIVYTLAADSMNGRYAGSQYENMARQFLETYILSFIGEDYILYTDSFNYCCRNDTQVAAHNIWLWPGHESSKVILLMAHYDHLPPCSHHSKEILNKNQIHPGADDNASGTAMALEIFRYMLLSGLPESYHIALLLVSGHEDGLFGSQNWITQHRELSESILICMNFDMIGRLSEETGILSVRLPNKQDINEAMAQIASDHGLKVMYDMERFQQTDTYHFNENNIFSLTFSTGIHTDYHRASDTPDKINFEGMMKLFGFFYDLISHPEMVFPDKP